MKKRILSTILALCMIMTLLPTVVFSADAVAYDYDRDNDGTNDSWIISSTDSTSVVYAYVAQNNSDGISPTYTLYLDGAGATAANKRPYDSYKPQVTSIWIGKNITDIGTGAFWQCTAATTVTFEEGSQLQSLGQNAFHSDATLTEITLPASLKAIGQAAFYGCSKLETVNFSNADNLESIGGSAFASCAGLKYFNNPNKSADCEWMPRNLSTLGGAAFNGDSALIGKVTIPKNVESLGERTFCKTTSISSFAFESGSKLKTIGKNVFENSIASELILPNQLESIGQDAFRGMTNLTSMTIPASVSSVTSPFYGCTGLHTLIFEKGSQVYTIGKLHGSMTSLTLPDKLTTISAEAFSYSSLKTLQLPATVVSIGATAFKGSASLHSLDLTALGQSVTIVDDAFAELGSIPSANPRIFNVIYIADQTLKTTISSPATFRSLFAITNGGTFSSGASFTANMLAHPAKAGYEFAGWFTDENLATEATNTNSSATEVKDKVYTALANQTYYAKWTLAKPVVEASKTRASYGETVTLSTDLVDGFTYAWKKNGEVITGADKNTLTLTDVADSGEYTVTVTVGGESLTSDSVNVVIEKADQSLSFADSAVSKRTNSGSFVNTLSGAKTDVTYASSDENVATVAADGTVTIQGRGECTITATAAATDNYKETTASYTLTVTKKSSSKPNKPAKPVVKPEPEPEKPVEPADEPVEIILTLGSPIASVDGREIVNDVAPVARNNRTMLPIRFVAEALGATVDWDADNQRVTITKGDLVIEIYIGSDVAYINGQPVQLDSPAFAENNRTYLPLRFVAETLGAIVEWDQTTQTVTITAK